MSDLNNYIHYIGLVQDEISKMFEQQKEYICCHEGCCSCCEEGMYPYSELEFRYLMKGYARLDRDTKQEVINSSRDLLKVYKENNCEYFKHKCPFLINKQCCVYPYRGLICRTHGLITEDDSGKLTLPYCAGLGLNYSKVYNTSTKMILLETVEKEHYKIIPKAFNLSRKNLMNLSLAKKLCLDFGETKMLIEWLFFELL